MNEIAASFPNLEMPTITDLGTEHPKIDGDMTYPPKENIDEAIRQKLRKNGVYESEMGQTNEQLQEKAASEATLQAVKTDQYPIFYLIVLKRLCF